MSAANSKGPGTKETLIETPSGKNAASSEHRTAPLPSVELPPLEEIELSAGQKLGDYTINEVIGRGGMSVVYGAVQPHIGKRVAIKVLLARYSTDLEVLARFLQEAQAVVRMGSDYVIDIFSYGQLQSGRPYFVMELLEGGSLRRLLREQGPLELGVAIPILLCVARALAAAHSLGIVHRDLKPQNIMIRRDGHGNVSAKVLDFGVAKLLDQGPTVSRLTQTGTAIGTPAYMSPEQVRSKKIDTRSDIYSFGITAFEVFSGDTPFSGDSYIDMANHHLGTLPHLPPEISARLPLALDSLIISCLAKDPEQRPQSMDQIIEVLDSAGDGAPPLSLSSAAGPPPGPGPAPAPGPVLAPGPEAPRSSPQRSPEHRSQLLGWGIGGGLVLLLALLGTLFGWPATSPSVAPPAPPMENVTRPAPRPTPPAPRVGVLTVTSSSPRAVISLDNEQVGQGKMVRLKRLPPGSHQLSVQAQGMRPFNRTVEISAGGEAQVHVELTPAAAPRRPHHPSRKNAVVHARQHSKPEEKPARPTTTGCVPQSKDPPYTWCDGPFKRIIHDRDLFWSRFARHSFGRVRCTFTKTASLYEIDAMRADTPLVAAALRRCISRHVRCNPEYWYLMFSVTVDDLGNSRSVKLHSPGHVKTPYPPAFSRCATEVLMNTSWGPTLKGVGGTFQLGFIATK